MDCPHCRYGDVVFSDDVAGGDPRLSRLLAALAESVALIRQRGDAHWADWLERDRIRVAGGDAYGLEHVKQAFGGMGSVNDTYPADDNEVGARLAEIYGMAAQLLAGSQTADERGDLASGTSLRCVGSQDWEDVQVSNGGDHVEFTPESTRRVLAKVCAVVGLDPAGAELVRLGENAIFALSIPPVVVRIARSAAGVDDVAAEMRVARWLAAESYPAARLAEVADDRAPLVVSGHAVTFWDRLPGGGEPPTRVDLAGLLRDLHSLAVPPGVALPAFNPFRRIPERLMTAPPEVADADCEFLRERLAVLAAELAALDFPTSPCAVHGDAHPGNLMRDAAGAAVLIDFEAFCFGPREWDLVPTAAYRHGFDRISVSDYLEFVAAYGGDDVIDWPGFATLRSIRELGMTTWLMQMVGHDDAARMEFSRRVADLRSGHYPRRWRKF